MQVILHTNQGSIKINLEEKLTPKTTQNFVRYIEEGFFKDTIFHRVIKGFMIQGGGLLANMSNKKTHAPIENEADLGIANKKGTIAMARTNDPHSASCQFFINLADNGFLDHRAKTPDGWGYCAFGTVVEGMDVVEKIGHVRTTSRAGHQDVPFDAIVIESAEVVVEETVGA